MALFNHLKNVNILQNKRTAGMTIIPIIIPNRVYIPLTQGKCDTAHPLVKPGDVVRVGQLIADSDTPMGCPIHSSVSGTVSGIVNLMSSSGKNDIHIVIDTDKQQLPTDIHLPQITNRDDFIAATRASGIIGMGGHAGMPLYRKFSFEPGTVKTLIVNGTESESFSTCDHMTMMSYPKEIISCIRLIMDALELNECFIAIEDNKDDAIGLFNKTILENGISNIKVEVLPSVYPQSEDNSLIFSCTGKRMGKDETPADIGVVVINVMAVLKLQQYITMGMPLVSRAITIDGDAIAKPQNVEVPIGMLASDIIESCGGYAKPVKKIIFGGPINGIALPTPEVPTTKTVSTILCFSKEAADMNEETACIRCGRCVNACPMNLMPYELADAYDADDFEFVANHHADMCIECNACSYICPARRQLSFRIKRAKEEVINGR